MKGGEATRRLGQAALCCVNGDSGGVCAGEVTRRLGQAATAAGGAVLGSPALCAQGDGVRVWVSEAAGDVTRRGQR